MVQKIVRKAKKGVFYRISPRSFWVSNDRKWLNSGDENRLLKYSGEIWNNLPHGIGTDSFQGNFYF